MKALSLQFPFQRFSGTIGPMKVLAILLAVSATWAADRQKIPVPKPFTVCKKDVDCALTVELCGCCRLTAMNKKFVPKYAALEKYCKEAAPPCQCQDPGLIPKCVKKICRLVPGNSATERLWT